MKFWYVYIMTNRKDGVIYIGVTDNIEARIEEHKTKFFKNSFTAKYNCNKLIYLEEYEDGFQASKGEKQMKKWKREWKINLMEEINPGWNDLSINWKNSDLIYKSKRFLDR